MAASFFGGCFWHRAIHQACRPEPPTGLKLVPRCCRIAVAVAVDVALVVSSLRPSLQQAQVALITVTVAIAAGVTGLPLRLPRYGVWDGRAMWCCGGCCCDCRSTSLREWDCWRWMPSLFLSLQLSLRLRLAALSAAAAIATAAEVASAMRCHRGFHCGGRCGWDCWCWMMV